MPAVENLRSPHDRTAGGLCHLGRMIDKMRLQQAGRLPEDFQRNYGLTYGLDGQLCAFLNVKFEDVEARVKQGGTDAEIAEWVLSQGLRPNRQQSYVWNEYLRKLGWNDRATPVLEKAKAEAGFSDRADIMTILGAIEVGEGRPPVPPKT